MIASGLELVDQGRALIPVYGPEWTDHNASDPGITLIELLAWIAEMDIYELNQISDRERLKFLKLVDVVPKGPLPAQAAMRITLDNGAPLSLPAGWIAGDDATSIETRFRTREAIMLAPGTLEALQFKSANGFQDLTPAWRRRSTMSPFGPAPQPGMEFFLGLSTALPVDVPVQFFFTFADGHSACGDRRRIVQEMCSIERDCSPPRNPCAQGAPKRGCHERDAEEISAPAPETCGSLEHYGVRTVWEFLSAGTAGSKWVALDLAKKEVEDKTRAFTLDGSVIFQLPKTMAMEQKTIGAVQGSFYYLRCRFEAGAYDAAPLLEDIAFNGIRITQSVPSGSSFLIVAGAKVNYAQGQPKPGDRTPLTMTLDGQQRIVDLTFGGGPATSPSFLIYDYRAPSGTAAGLLAIEGVFLGFGSGFPNQQFTLPGAPVEQSGLRITRLKTTSGIHGICAGILTLPPVTIFTRCLTPLRERSRSARKKGRVPPEIQTADTTPLEQCLVFATYESTRAEAGNLSRGAINQLADSQHNRTLFYDPVLKWGGLANVKKRLKEIANPLAAESGAAAETLAHASERADLVIQNSDRAITLKDYERLALQTPGTLIARVSARANLHPSFPCFKAPGMITVIVLPFLSQGRPMPSPGLLHTVASYLRRRRIIGTRVEVVAPVYLDVSVQAEVQALPGSNKTSLQTAVVAALNQFLDPLHGGLDGSGWPFGRDVYRSEIMRVIDEVPGVDYVASLALIGENGQPQCGNICLGPTWLVAAGKRQITIR